MKSIAIIACFIGKVHNYFGLWLKSAAANPTVDFYLVGEMNLEDYVLPANCYVKKYSLEELEQEVRVKLNVPEAVIGVAYKTGDYRPMFGELFQDWLKDYDVWGYCDIDLVFGDLRKFLTDELLEKYDKIYPLGHLSLYRNTQEVNLRWRLPEARYDIQDVLTKPEVFAFDEWRGIHNIYMRKGFPFYRNVDFASPIAGTYRYKFANRSNPKYERNPDNYEQMCFYWEDGKVFRAFNAGSRRHPDIRTDEFVYMHFLKRRFPNAPTQECLDARAFFCSPQGFFPKKRLGVPTLEEIMTYNPLPKGGRIVEMLQSLLGRLIKLKSKIAKKLFHQNKQGAFAERDDSLHELRKW